jgi:GNAT superfamily N-acetyltransferase
MKKAGVVHFEKAKASDAQSLAEVSTRAFDNAINYGALGPGGPPGYNSEMWQRKMMRLGSYYKILFDGQIVGGVIIFRKAVREYEVGRIFIDPDFQNQGIGTAVFAFIWEAFPLAKRWTLGTPAWNQRNRHFYQKMGFEEVGQDEHNGILFEI